MSNETEFVDGLVVSRNEAAPDYIICNLWIKRAEFSQFMRAREGDLNVTIKRSRNGKYYAVVDNWRPSHDKPAPVPDAPAPAPAPRENPVAVMDDDIPFANPYRGKLSYVV